MKTALDRFLEYVRINTQSCDSSETHPSFSGELILAEKLKNELLELGIHDARVSPEGVVYASIPATPGCEDAPALGLIAHVDTSDAASGENVKPSIVTFTGTPIHLGTSCRTLDPAVFPTLNRMKGEKLVVTDGTTLLGADDKAGVAEIMAAVDAVLSESIPHGKLCIGFTPDEEIGTGWKFLDIQSFGADFAYTVDGGALNEIEYQCFNAAMAEIKAQGVSVHTGSAKNIMINAAALLMEFHAMLPPEEVPEKTEGFEGFFHLLDMKGDVSSALSRYLIRDHNRVHFEEREELLRRNAALLNKKYGKDVISLQIREQYRNMEEIIVKHPILLENAERAVRHAGGNPVFSPIRGGTDGANLSFKGLPCPNLGMGGYNYHGEYEFLCVREMAAAVEMLKELIRLFSTGKK